MARSSRRSNLTFTPLSKFFLLALLVIGVSGFLTVKQSGVLGTSDSKNSEAAKKQLLARKNSCNRVVSFSAGTICESNSKEKANNAFKTYTYTCEDGTTGTVTPKTAKISPTPSGSGERCMPLDRAFEGAKELCKKSCKLSPTPTKSAPTPTTEVPTPTTSN